jgi:hypothetical protein
MKYLFVISIFAFLFFCHCKDDTAEDQQESSGTQEDSTESLDTVFSAKDISFLGQLKFSKYATSQRAPVDWSKFRMVTSSQDDPLLVSKFQPDSSYYERYGWMLRYSPDSSMFIDLDSYNIEFQKNRKGQLIAFENGPDTEVSLVNLENKEKTRLVFLGPGNGVEDAGWIDNNNAILVGYHEKDTTKSKKTVIWRYHVPTKTFHVYESSDTTIAARLLNWRRQRFRQIQ